MKKIVLALLAISTVTLAQTTGDITAKVGVVTSSFKGVGGSLELSGKAKFDYDINIEGNINFIPGYKLTEFDEYSDNYKIYDNFNNKADVLWGQEGTSKKGLLKDTYLKISKGFGDYGSVELKQQGIHATSLSYVSPTYQISGLEVYGKAGYTLAYYVDTKGISTFHRGDLDTKVSYEVIDGLKLSAEAGLVVSNTSDDTTDTNLKFKDDKIAIIPKVALGVDYNVNNLETSAKLEYQKEGLGIDLKASYDISELVGVEGLSLKPMAQLSNSTKFAFNSTSDGLKNRNITNLVIVGAGIDLKYNINDNLSFVSNAKFNTIYKVEHKYVNKIMKENMLVDEPKTTIVFTNNFFNPSISAGIKYNF